MNGIWLMYKDKDTEYVTLCTSFDIVRVSGIRELHFTARDVDDSDSFFVTTEDYHNIDAIINTIKNAISFGSNHVTINLADYEVSKRKGEKMKPIKKENEKTDCIENLCTLTTEALKSMAMNEAFLLCMRIREIFVEDAKWRRCKMEGNS